MKRRTFLQTSLGATAAIASPSALAAPPVAAPTIRREFRGLWVASVDFIDWPSKPNLSNEALKAELIVLLERAKKLNFNAVLLQVRPACDALYRSEKEPWSEYLTGTMGKSIDFDPLAFAVEEAHKRGLELHAWVNPFRARQSGATSPLDPLHIIARRPELVKRYGRLLWLDPGEPDAHAHSLAVLMDIVQRYDIDGLHMDDYFYPYVIWQDEKNKIPVPFPDDAAYAKYQTGGGTLARDDWRRDNINRFVQSLYTQIKAAKPHVKFGISPFGIWRPGNPPQIQGYDAYALLYGDAKLWMEEGWADYFAPQLYWRIDQTAQSFPVLLQWWASQNLKNRHLWPGVIVGKFDPTETEFQIRTTRGIAPAPGSAPGTLHFSAKTYLSSSTQDRTSVAGRLVQTVYSDVALVPAYPWLGEAKPQPPIGLGAKSGVVRWQHVATGAPAQYALQLRLGTVWRTVVLSGTTTEYRPQGAFDAAVLTALDRLGAASPSVTCDAK